MTEMNKALYLAKNGEANIVDINKYYQDNKEIADRFEITKGKSKYDIDQGKVFKELGTQIKNNFNRFANEVVLAEEKKLARTYKDKELEKDIQDLEMYVEDYKKVSKASLDRMRRMLGSDPNLTKRTLATLGAEGIRVLTDANQFAVNATTNMLSAGILNVINPVSKLARIGVIAGAGAVENTLQESYDIYSTEDRLPTLEELFFAAGTGGVASVGFAGIGVGSRRILNSIKNSEIDVIRNIRSSFGYTGQIDPDITRATIQNMMPFNESLGKTGSLYNIVPDNLEINSVKLPIIREYTASIINNVIDDPKYPNIKSVFDFNELLESNPQQMRTIISRALRNKSLGADDIQAFRYYYDVTNPNQITDIYLDMNGVARQLIKNFDDPVVIYEPTLYPSNIQKVITTRYGVSQTRAINGMDLGDLAARRQPIKNDYKIFKKGALESELRITGIIPEEADVIYARGYKDKETKNYVIKSEFIDSGKRFFADFRKNEKGDYQGYVFPLDEETIQILPTVQPKNIIEEVFPEIDIPETKRLNKLQMRKLARERLGIEPFKPREIMETVPKTDGKIVMDTFISIKELGINSKEEFSQLITQEPQLMKELAEMIMQEKKLSKEQKKAFSNFLELWNKTPAEILEPQKPKTVLINEIDKKDLKLHIYETTADEFENKKTVIRHNPRDYNKDQITQVLKGKGAIPKEAKVTKAKGYVSRTKYPIQTGVDADGNPVFTRSRWQEKEAIMSVEFTISNTKYHGLFSQDPTSYGIVGDIYKLKVDTTEPKIKSKSKAARKNEIIQYFKEKLNLNKRFTSAEQLTNDMLAVQKEFGKTVRKKNNIDSIQKMLDFYKFKYNIDFEFVGAKKIQHLGETIIKKNKDGSRILQVAISDKIKDLDTQIGVLRHEIQHILDLYNTPEFRSKEFNPVVMDSAKPIEEVLKGINRGHFADYSDDYFELSYIIKNAMDNLVDGDKLNPEFVEVLKLDIPKVIDKDDVSAVKKIIKETGNEIDVSERLAKLKAETNKYFKIKDGLRKIYRSNENLSGKARRAKDFLKTQILLPFQKTKEQSKTKLLNLFTLDYKGQKLDLEKMLDLFEENKFDLRDFLFSFNRKLPDELAELQPKLEDIRETLYQTVKELTKDYDINVQDIYNNLNYDSNLSLEKLLSQDELQKYLTTLTKEFDGQKYLDGELIADPVTGKDVPKRLVDPRERFAERNYDFFMSSVERLEVEIKKENPSPYEIIQRLKEIKTCIPSDERFKIISKYNLEQYPEVQRFLKNNKDFFEDLPGTDFDRNNIESKKQNARRAFTEDMDSYKGAEENPLKETAVHRFGRFENWIDRGYIKKSKVKDFVANNKVDGRLALQKLINEISNAEAIKSTFPQGGYKGFKKLLGELQTSTLSRDFKSYMRELEGYIDVELGRDLGHITKPIETSLDRFVKKYTSVYGKINLTGPKAFRELYMEPMSMVRANISRYGGDGFFTTYKQVMNNVIALMMNVNNTPELMAQLKNSMPIEYVNAILGELDDFTGYRKARMIKYGSNQDKLLSALDSGLNKLNLYQYTQLALKAAAYSLGGMNLEKFAKYSSLDELLNSQGHYFKKMIEDLNIGSLEFEFMKKIPDLESFKNSKLYDEISFSDSIKKTDIENYLGDIITDDEFNYMKNDIVDKVTKFYDKMVSDISPTEATAAARNEIDMINDNVRRNFARMTGFFKTSLQEQWRRLATDVFYSNVNNGKMDWTNKLWQKRMMNYMIQLGVVVVAGSLLKDGEFYEDPLGTVIDKFNDMVDSPGSALWTFFDDNIINSYALTTGSMAIVRPAYLIQNISKGDIDKAATNLIKMGINTTNYNIAKNVIELLQ